MCFCCVFFIVGGVLFFWGCFFEKDSFLNMKGSDLVFCSFLKMVLLRMIYFYAVNV